MNSLWRERISRFQPRYTFDTFVVGAGNRFARGAARAVSDLPGTCYNPLFIYGETGLGKTHLLHAIGQRIESRFPDLHVLYNNCERFANEMVQAVRAADREELQNKYRTAGVLLLDDIQFIARHESIQEEFFHTFNTLHQAGRQIVVTSDQPPKHLRFGESLRSRFEGGLVADIQPPDLETRVAILESKAGAQQQRVEAEVLQYIASRIPRNIRELEGALNQVVAYATVNDQPVTTEIAEAALTGLRSTTGRRVSVEDVLEATARRFSVSMDELRGPRRTPALAVPRQIAMYLARTETAASYGRVGALLGGRDHSTVMHGCDKIERLLQSDLEVRREVLALRDALYSLR